MKEKLKKIILLTICSTSLLVGCNKGEKVYIYPDGTEKTESEILEEKIYGRFVKTGNIYKIKNDPGNPSYSLVEIEDKVTGDLYVVMTGDGWHSGITKIGNINDKK